MILRLLANMKMLENIEEDMELSLDNDVHIETKVIQ